MDEHEHDIRVEGRPLALPGPFPGPKPAEPGLLLEMWKERALQTATFALQFFRCQTIPEWARLYGIDDEDLWTVFLAPYISREFLGDGGDSSGDILLEAWARRYKAQIGGLRVWAPDAMAADPAGVVKRMREHFERRTLPEGLTADQLVEGLT